MSNRIELRPTHVAMFRPLLDYKADLLQRRSALVRQLAEVEARVSGTDASAAQIISSVIVPEYGLESSKQYTLVASSDGGVALVELLPQPRWDQDERRDTDESAD